MNKKEICSECKRTLRIKCFVFNKLRKKRICRKCDKKIGSNIFYVPFKKKADWISKYGLTEEEKKRLHSKFISQGISSTEAWRKVYQHVRLLKQQKEKTRYSDKQRKRYFAIKAKERKEQQKKFIRGLR